MEKAELDAYKRDFESALERWIRSIQNLQRVLAGTSHSAKSEDIWREADFEQEEAQKNVKAAREAYQDAVRKANFDF